jgi:tRNA pseudouridine38-40 synthase
LREIQPGISTVQGSGRTDAGVHALAQVAHFDEAEVTRMDGRAWREALNNRLPAALRIMEAEEAAPEFHARFSARGKVYRYEIFTGPVLPPLLARRAWHVRQELNLGLIQEAAAMFAGYHDFTAFSANRGDPASEPADRRRSILRSEVTVNGPAIHLEFEGDGFLYKMVRMMTGAIVRAGSGALAPQQIREWLKQPEPGRKSPIAAPPDGLYLVRVRYE